MDINQMFELMNIIEHHCENDENVFIVGSYDYISGMMNTLIKNIDKMEFVFGELSPAEIDGYDEAWYLEVSDYEIYTGKMYNDLHKKYVMTDADFAFVENDYLTKYLESNPGDNVTVLTYDDENLDVDNPCICVTDDRKGFTCCVDFCDPECGETHTKIVYRGDKVLSDKDIMEIIDREF